jgi:4,5-DOPA dioxygenase extradiol
VNPVFVSHGAPTIVLEDSPARHFLAGWGRILGRPRAILVASAHWTTHLPLLSSAARPETIHDFGGFDPALYRMHYRAPGDPALAERAAGLLRAAGIDAALDPQRGFDHGVWTPLTLMYPQADIPIVSLSVQPQRDPAHHVALGRALAPLADDGVLIMGSGAATHDLRRFAGQSLDSPPPADVRGFAGWLADTTARGDEAALREVWTRARDARANHPTPEHLLPFHVAFGAGGGRGERTHASFSYGVLAMDAYRFGMRDKPPRAAA